MIVYSLMHPTVEALSVIEPDNLESGKKLIESLAKKHKYPATVTIVSVAELQLKSEEPMPPQFGEELKTICDYKQEL